MPNAGPRASKACSLLTLATPQRQAITVWLTADETSDVFAQGRHILSPTPAHDSRAVRERSPDAVEGLPTAQTKTKSAAEAAAEDAERLAQAAAEAAAAAARAAADAAEQAAQAAAQAEEKRAAAAALAASAVRVEEIDRCGDCRVLHLTLLPPPGGIPTHY